MLTITSTPQNFTPISQGIIFSVESTTQTDFNIQIINNTNGLVVGNKIVYGTTSATIDISPYIETISSHDLPARGKCTLQNAPTVEYYIYVETELERISSDIVILSNNLELPIAGVNSVMPRRREIGYGEEDDMRIYAKPQSTVRLQMTSDRGEYIELEMYTESGAIELHFASGEYKQNPSYIAIDMFCNGSLLQTFSFTIVPRYKGAVRLMWLSPAGNIEHFTFPIVVSRSTVVEKRRLSSSLTGVVVSTISAERMTLCTQNLTESLRNALTTIVTATKVWLDDGSNTEVTVLEGEIITSQFGKMGAISLTVEYNGKEVVS